MALSAFLSILAADLIVSVLSFFAKNYVTSRDSRSNTLLHTLRSVSPTGKAREFILLRMSDLASRIDFKLQEELVVGGANSDGDCSTRLHDYLLVAFPQHFSSLTGAKKAIRKGLIILNAKRASVTDTVAFGDSVQYYTRSSAARLDSMMERLNQTVELVKLEVLYEDDFCAVILKPQGLAVYPAHDSEYASNNSDSKISGSVQSSLLVSLAPTNQSAIGTNGTPLRRPVPVHRLDQATGGLLLIAKTAEALSSLTESFSSRNITKKYRAVVQGNMTGLVDALSLTDYSYLSLYSKERSEIAVKFSIKGKIAETRIRIVKVATMENKTITIVDASPITGRKHQIRR